MNAELERLVREAGAPEEVMTELWFRVFCIHFADRLIAQCEAEIVDTK